MKSDSKNKKKTSIKAVGLVLAGGESKRLFPWKYSKTLLEINGESLLNQALDRLSGLKQAFVVTNTEISKEIKNHFKSKKLNTPGFLLEPEPRDTAAAIGFALSNLKSKPDWVVVLSGDQYIPDTKKFRQFLKKVEKEIIQFPDALFVAGSLASVKPKDSHSQFGWILPKKSSQKENSYVVETFIEKPKGSKLEQLRKKKGLINAGMFFGRYETFIEAYKALYPSVMKKKLNYSQLEKQPVDRAIFEKYKNVRVLPFDIPWEDLGTWDAIHSKVGGHFASRVKSKNTFVWNDTKKREVYLFGVKDLAVIETKDKTLIMPISETPRLKDYLQKIDNK